MAVTHRGVGDEFTFSVASAEHVTGIAVSAPTSVVAGQTFSVKIEVVCLTAGCDLTGKKIQVKDTAFKLIAEGTLTERFLHVPSGKYGYRGYVKTPAPTVLGSYTWWGMFPAQSGHKASMARFGMSTPRAEARGFPTSPVF